MNTIKIYLPCLIFFCCLNIISQTQKPNILLITLDDMNWNSPGSSGGIIPDLTPNIDALAKQGVSFNNAYVQAPNCSPSRAVIQTGLYPHQSGVRGFFYVKDNIKTLPEILQEDGYFTGVLNKVADSSINPNFDNYWNESLSIKGNQKRDAKMYADLLTKFLRKSSTTKKPFYCVVNIADPHKPFFNDKNSQKLGFDKFQPSKVYTLKDVKIPDFLPKNNKIKQEVLNYYNSVRRGDDCVGEIIKELQKNPILKENTIIILLSDHGMPFPFAKSSLYQNGLKTPLIISYPSKIEASVDDKSIISAIDIAPTILDLVKSSIQKNMAGKSFYKALTHKKEKIGKYVFAQFDENAGGIPRPSRTIISKKFGYIFNPWATGSYAFQSAASWHTTYKQMAKISKKNKGVHKRFNHWKYREIEELYDYENDPDALNNLINDSNYKEILAELRNQLATQMESTNDYVLKTFNRKNDTLFLNNWMKNQEELAEIRRLSIKWKRGKNYSGKTKGNSKLYQIE